MSVTAAARRSRSVRSPLAEANAAKPACPSRHPYDDENTYRRPSDGARICRACQRERRMPGGREPGWPAQVTYRSVRIACGISQQAIATALGVSQATVSTWETGEREPSGARGAAYGRVIAGLLRHLTATDPGISESGENGPEEARAA